jgi:hypothetical protein
MTSRYGGGTPTTIGHAPPKRISPPSLEGHPKPLDTPPETANRQWAPLMAIAEGRASEAKTRVQRISPPSLEGHQKPLDTTTRKLQTRQPPPITNNQQPRTGWSAVGGPWLVLMGGLRVPFVAVLMGGLRVRVGVQWILVSSSSGW